MTRLGERRLDFSYDGLIKPILELKVTLLPGDYRLIVGL